MPEQCVRNAGKSLFLHYGALQGCRFEFDNEWKFRSLEDMAVDANRSDIACAHFNAAATSALERRGFLLSR